MKDFLMLSLILGTLVLGGCASRPELDQQHDEKSINHQTDVVSKNEDGTTYDPFASINRVVWDINYDVLDKFLLKPVTVGYITIMPQFARTGLLNASNNLLEPASMVNNLLQGKGENSAISLGRFIINSTVGLVGLFDVATEMGLHSKEEEFNEVLGVWGVNSGPYLMLPAIGPSDARDLTGKVVDRMIWPTTVLNNQIALAASVVSIIETRAQLIDQEGQINQSLDPYLFVRDAYFQRVRYKILDGKVPEPTIDLEQQEDDFSAFEDMLEGL